MDGGSRRGGAAVSRASLLSDLHAVMDQALRQAFPASYSADYCLKGRMVQAQPREAAEAHYVCEASVPLFGRLGGRGCGSAPLTPSASQSRLSASTTPLSSVGSSGDLAGMWGDSPATQPMDAHAPTPGEGAASTVWGQFAAHQPPPSPVLPSAAGLHTPSEGISSLFSDAKLQEMGEPDWAKDPDSSPLADCPQRGASPSAEAFLAHAPPQVCAICGFPSCSGWCIPQQTPRTKALTHADSQPTQGMPFGGVIHARTFCRSSSPPLVSLCLHFVQKEEVGTLIPH